MTEPPLGLRESKKRRTRLAISEHAVRLFIARGFEATTVAEVAAAARVAKKTVTNYFPRKEDLALDFQEEFIASLAVTARSRASGTPVLTALRVRHREDVRDHAATAGFSSSDFARMIADSPTLTARLRELHELRERALAEALAESGPAERGGGDRGGDRDGLGTRAVAAHLATAHRVLFQRVQELSLAGLPPHAIADTVTEEAQQVFDLLEPSFGGYGS
ncbi:TetR family transcriptional regulator [Catenulispora subtropica]|uniref:TetR family transcriptional regulator n=1 Tax=Catenulispora subtropica TaxID=450798 RepID=A0ABN2QUN8_9ACTN